MSCGPYMFLRLNHLTLLVLSIGMGDSSNPYISLKSVDYRILYSLLNTTKSFYLILRGKKSGVGLTRTLDLRVGLQSKRKRLGGEGWLREWVCGSAIVAIFQRGLKICTGGLTTKHGLIRLAPSRCNTLQVSGRGKKWVLDSRIFFFGTHINCTPGN